MKHLSLFITITSIALLYSCEENNANTENASQTTPAMTHAEEYFTTHDTVHVAADAVFVNMTTGEQTKGRKAISDMLHYMYKVAFDAHADIKHTMVTDKNAVLEANFAGTHIGDFAGIPATGKQVNFPLCVTYDLNSDGLIKEARIYMLADLQQLK